MSSPAAYQTVISADAVGKVLVDHRVDRETVEGHEHGVAVTRCTCDFGCADAPAGAHAVLDDHRLSEFPDQLVLGMRAS